MQEYITKSEKETFQLAQKLAKDLKGGEVIALVGELGVGKTLFTQGLASGIGIKENVNSPTFVIMKIYKTKYKKIRKLVHIDAYRINFAKEISNIGAEEYFNKKDTITVIEWANKIKSLLPKKTLFYEFFAEKNKRIINFKAKKQ